MADESPKKSASSSATRCRRASSSPSSGRCATGSTARPSGGRRSSWSHDEENDAKIGDIVEIVETRPLSRRKRWALDSGSRCGRGGGGRSTAGEQP